MPLQCWGTLWWFWGWGMSALGSQQLAPWLQVLTKHLPWWHLSLEEGLSGMGRSYQHRGRCSPLGTHRLQHPSHPSAVPHPGGACKAKAVPGTAGSFQTAVLKPPPHHSYLPPSPSLAPNTEEPWHPAMGTPMLCAPLLLPDTLSHRGVVPPGPEGCQSCVPKKSGLRPLGDGGRGRAVR